MHNLPWQWIQSFIWVAKSGSLSKAAVGLNSSQPTLSRHIAGLEQQLKVTLFDRSTQGLRLTGAGEKLIESSKTMQMAAEQFTRIASGEILSLQGNIRISANEVIGLYYLPKIIVQFNLRYPEVNVEVDISNKTTSLNKRDTDIALRMFRPTQVDLIAKRLPDIALNFVAGRDYLAQHGPLNGINDLAKHKLIGFDRDQQFLKAIKQFGWPISADDFSSKTDFLPLQIELARNGAGISITHEYLVKQFIELQAVLPEIPLPKLEFWLVCHRDVQHNQRIRVMMDFLANALQRLLIGNNS